MSKSKSDVQIKYRNALELLGFIEHRLKRKRDFLLNDVDDSRLTIFLQQHIQQIGAFELPLPRNNEVNYVS